MKKTSRQSQIIEAVSRDGSLETADLADRLGVSGETIRRDVKELQRKGLLKKIHGGAALPGNIADTPFHERLKDNGEGKRRIAEAIADIIQDGDSLLIETGTTTTYVAQALSRRKRLTIITNSVDVARSLAFRSDNEVFMAGGRLTSDDGAALDHTAIAYVSQFRVKYAIFSVAGLHPQDGLMAHRLTEADFTRTVISRAEKVILAVDQTKFGRTGMVRICGPETVDIMVTDGDLDPTLSAMFQHADVRSATR